MPPSVASEHIQVQYLLVAAVHFQNGCCGWIPMLARDSILAKREVRVRCGVVGVDSGFSSAGTTDVIDAAFMERVEACQAMLHDEAVAAARRRSSGGDKTIAAAPDDGGPDGFATLDEAADGAVPNADAIKPNIDPDSAKSADGDSQDAAAKINPAEMPILVVVRPTAGDANGSHADDEIDRMGQRAPELLWTPTCNVLAYVPTFAALDQATLRLHLRLAETHSPARVDWELMQTEEYQFRYDVSGSRMSDAKFEPGECTREYGHILADGIVTTFDEAPPASGEPCERAFMVDLDLSGGRRSDVEAVEDIRSTVATVMHYLNLKLSLVCDNEPARTETYRATCPLVMHDLAPSGEGSARAEPAGECVDQHVPLKIEPLASQAVAACSDAAAPAAEPDAAAPAMHDGLRRRRVGESLQSGAEEEASTTAPDTE
nr:hypothetical protein HK105_006625 [Polyrhizophydium stewartii]